MQILDQVGGADDEHRKPRMRTGNRLEPQESARRLDHRPDRKVRCRPGFVECSDKRKHVGGGLDLRGEHRVRAAAGNGRHVGAAPRRGQRIDTHDELTRAVATLPDRRDNLFPREILRIRGDRVLEIEDQPIGRQRARLVECACIGARHVEHRPARTQR